jgi:hypothetical protein
MGISQEAWRETHHAATGTVALPGINLRCGLRRMTRDRAADFASKSLFPGIDTNSSATMLKKN